MSAKKVVLPVVLPLVFEGCIINLINALFAQIVSARRTIIYLQDWPSMANSQPLTENAVSAWLSPRDGASASV